MLLWPVITIALRFLWCCRLFVSLFSVYFLNHFIICIILVSFLHHTFLLLLLLYHVPYRTTVCPVWAIARHVFVDNWLRFIFRWLINRIWISVITQYAEEVAGIAMWLLHCRCAWQAHLHVDIIGLVVIACNAAYLLLLLLLLLFSMREFFFLRLAVFACESRELVRPSYFCVQIEGV